MAVAQLFAATHTDALARAEALDAGEEPRAAVDLTAVVPGVGPIELEALGEVAARVVRFGAGDLEVAEVDLAHESLFRLPDFLCEVLAELGTTEDPDALPDATEHWGATDEMAGEAGRPDTDLRDLVDAVVGVVVAAREADLDVYLWTPA